MLHFTKMNGAGNDFILIDNRDGKNTLDRETIARICDRHRGAGADGLLAVEPPQSKAGEADFRMRYYNSDGGEAEMCGNGARCFARFASRLCGRKDRLRFETIAGVISAEFVGEDGTQVRLAMSEPHDLRLRLPVPVPGETLIAHFVNTGVPHAIVFVESPEALEKLPVQTLGAAVRYHEIFAPRGTNANFIAQTAPGTIAIRTYERGVEGETLACGTGVVAAALVFHEIAGAKSPVHIQVRGGETLQVGFEVTAAETPTGTPIYRNVTLTGPADFVFEGEIEV